MLLCTNCTLPQQHSCVADKAVWLKYFVSFSGEKMIDRLHDYRNACRARSHDGGTVGWKLPLQPKFGKTRIGFATALLPFGKNISSKTNNVKLCPLLWSAWIDLDHASMVVLMLFLHNNGSNFATTNRKQCAPSPLKSHEPLNFVTHVWFLVWSRGFLTIHWMICPLEKKKGWRHLLWTKFAQCCCTPWNHGKVTFNWLGRSHRQSLIVRTTVVPFAGVHASRPACMIDGSHVRSCKI